MKKCFLGKKVSWFCMMMVVALAGNFIAGCQSNVSKTAGGENAGAPVKLVWYYPAESSEGGAEIFAAANKIVKEKINAEIQFEPYSRGEYGQKVMLKMSAGEVIDICYTSSWLFPYRDGVSKSGFIALDDLINQYAPKTKELIPEKIWNATKINGKIYGIPNYQMSFVKPSLVFQKALVEKYNLQEKIDQITKLEDLTPIFEIIRQNEPDIIPCAFSPHQSLYSWGKKQDYYEHVISEKFPIGVDYSLKALNLSEGKPGEIEMNTFRLAREWNQKGYFHKDVGIPRDITAEVNAGKYFVFYDTYKPGIEAEEEQIHGYPVYVKTLGDPILSQASVTGTLSAIGRTSKNPEKAMEFLELINNDKELYNTVIFGLDGKQYKKIGADKIEILPESGYNTYAWAMGCNFNAFKLPTQEDDVWEKTIEMNEAAFASPLLNYFIDTDKVKTQIANVGVILDEYMLALTYGLLENYEEVAKDVYTRAHDDLEVIRTEVQKQIDEQK